MSNNYKDPELIRSYGDDIEQYFAEQILTRIPGYATFWATYIGNDGSHNSLPMPGASSDAYESRSVLWQNLYTLFESLALCWFLEEQFRVGERIQSNADYLRNLNAWTAFYAHLGRIHDMAEKATTILRENRLFAQFDPFYEQRHIALHGIKVPMRWADSVLCAPPLGEKANEWHTQMAWKDLGETQFDYLSANVSSTLRALEPVIAGFFDTALQLAEPRLHLQPVEWPAKPQPRAAYATNEFRMSGTQSCQAVSTSPDPPRGYSGLHPLIPLNTTETEVLFGEDPDNHKPTPADSLKVTVDKATFLEVGRVFTRVFRGRAPNVTLTLGPCSLRIEFSGGGCELPCVATHTLVARLTGKAFADIITAYRSEKSPSGTTPLTFRSNLGEFATPLAGGKAKFIQPPTLST